MPLRHRVAWVSLCSVGFGSLMSICSDSEPRLALRLLPAADDRRAAHDDAPAAAAACEADLE